jgi:hypothetical protein
MAELVDYVEHAVLPALMGAVLDEVVGPNMVRVFGAKTDAGSVGEPETASLRLFVRDFQPFATPDALDPFVVHQPAGSAQQFGDLAIAVAAILASELDDVGRQPLLLGTALRDPALRRAMLTERRTGTALGDGQLPSDMLDAGAAPRRAQ